MRVLRSVVVVFCLAAATAESSADIVFSDGFEAPSIDPFWSVRSQSGTIARTASKSHSGSSSMQFSSTSTSQDKWLLLSHKFDQPIFGTVSVWVFDTGAGASSSNYLMLSAERINASNQSEFGASIVSYDYGFQGGGPGRGDQYNLTDTPVVADIFASGVARSAAWHEFKISALPTGLSLAIDGTTRYSRAGSTSFNQVTIGMFGPSWRPEWTSQFDDFTVASAVPEPGTFGLFAIGGVAALGLARRRKSSRRAS